jgi:hypothetical protein
VITVFPGILGGKSLFAPVYQYVFVTPGSNEPDVSRSQLDLYLVWILADGKNWLIVDPQVIVDHENDVNPALTEVEWGFMIAPSVGPAATFDRAWGLAPTNPTTGTSRWDSSSSGARRGGSTYPFSTRFGCVPTSARLGTLLAMDESGRSSTTTEENKGPLRRR